MKFTDTIDDTIMHFDYEEELLTIQIVEGRKGPNALITLTGDELKEFIKYVKENLK